MVVGEFSQKPGAGEERGAGLSRMSRSEFRPVSSFSLSVIQSPDDKLLPFPPTRNGLGAAKEGEPHFVVVHCTGYIKAWPPAGTNAWLSQASHFRRSGPLNHGLGGEGQGQGVS